VGINHVSANPQNVTFQPDAGTNPSGTTFTVTSSDSSLVITGTAATDTLDFTKGTTVLTIGDAITSSTSGSILFADASNQLAQDNANLFWDNTNNRLGLGTTSPVAALDVNGGEASNLKTITNGDSPYTALVTDHTILADASSGAITINLPTAVGLGGFHLRIKKIDATVNIITVDGNGSQTIDGALTYALFSQYGAVQLISDNANWQIITRTALQIPVLQNNAFTTQGIGNGTFYTAGFYRAPAADANLTNAAPTVAYGTAASAYGAHAFAVSGGNGSTDGSDLVLTVSGTSITDAGVRTTSDSEVIVATATSSALNTYYETTKKWLGPVTYTLTSTGGTTFNYDFNYGLAKYEDLGNRVFKITQFEVTGLAGATDAGFNVALLHHHSTGWTYSAAAFVPGDGAIVALATDYSTDRSLVNGEAFAYKRTGLSTLIDGSSNEGYIVRITTTVNNSIEMLNSSVGVLT